MLPLTQYSKVKDRYCITYLGAANEYLLLLSYLKPAIEAELPGLQLYLCGRDETVEKNEVAFIREITCDLIHHPVERLINESNLQLIYWTPPVKKVSKGNNYVLCPNGVLPTKNLTSKEIDKLISKYGNFNITNNVEGADWVIGVESVGLVKAAMLGIRTTLIPTGIGMNFYKKIFPSLEILELQHI